MRLALIISMLLWGCGRLCPRAETLTGLDGGSTACVQWNTPSRLTDIVSRQSFSVRSTKGA